MQSVLLSQCLQNFTTFLLNDKTDCHTILIGHNSSVFDTPTLLRCAGPVVKELLSSNNVFFADSLPLVRALIKAGNPSLNPEGKACKTNLPAVFQTVFNEQFAAHDALEDVLALRRVLFQSSLKLAVADIVNNSNGTFHFLSAPPLWKARFRQVHFFPIQIPTPQNWVKLRFRHPSLG